MKPSTMQRLYQEQGLTLQQIAARAGCSLARVLATLKRLGVARRSPGRPARTPPAPPRAETPGPRRGPKRLRGEELIRAGQRDAEIGAALGVTREAVRQWRVAIGVAPLPRLGRPAAPSRARAEQLLRSGQLNDAEIARELDISDSSVSAWRRALALPCKGRRRPAPVGQRFAKLVVLGYDEERSAPRKLYFLCRCDCGGTTSAQVWHVLHGRTRSCGCLRGGQR